MNSQHLCVRMEPHHLPQRTGLYSVPTQRPNPVSLAPCSQAHEQPSWQWSLPLPVVSIEKDANKLYEILKMFKCDERQGATRGTAGGIVRRPRAQQWGWGRGYTAFDTNNLWVGTALGWAEQGGDIACMQACLRQLRSLLGLPLHSHCHTCVSLHTTGRACKPVAGRRHWPCWYWLLQAGPQPVGESQSKRMGYAMVVCLLLNLSAMFNSTFQSLATFFVA